MKRKPHLTKRERHAQILPTPAVCSRSLDDQLGPSGRTVRAGDHPRAQIYRVALMNDDQLAALRERDPQVHDNALDDELRLASEFDERLLADGMTPSLLRSEFDEKPILTFCVCTACRSLAIAEASRAWDVEDAMIASGLSERDVLVVWGLLVDVVGEGAVRATLSRQRQIRANDLRREMLETDRRAVRHADRFVEHAVKLAEVPVPRAPCEGLERAVTDRRQALRDVGIVVTEGRHVRIARCGDKDRAGRNRTRGGRSFTPVGG